MTEKKKKEIKLWGRWKNLSWPGSQEAWGSWELQQHIPGHTLNLAFSRRGTLLTCCCHLRNKLTKITSISSFVSAVLNTVKSTQKIHIHPFTQNLAYPGVHRPQLKAVLYSAQSFSQGGKNRYSWLNQPLKKQYRTVVVCMYPQPAALRPGHMTILGQWTVALASGTINNYLQETASSICVTLAKWAVFGMPKHLMPWAWRHSWEKNSKKTTWNRTDWTLSTSPILLKNLP